MDQNPNFFIANLKSYIDVGGPYEKLTQSAENFKTIAEKYMADGLSPEESQNSADFFTTVYDKAFNNAAKNAADKIQDPQIEKAIFDLSERVTRHKFRTLNGEFNRNRATDRLIGHTGLIGQLTTGVSTPIQVYLQMPLYLNINAFEDKATLRKAFADVTKAYFNDPSQIAEASPWMILVDEGLIAEEDINPPYDPRLRHETVRESILRVPKELRAWLTDKADKIPSTDFALLNKELSKIEQGFQILDVFMQGMQKHITASQESVAPLLPQPQHNGSAHHIS